MRGAHHLNLSVRRASLGTPYDHLEAYMLKNIIQGFMPWIIYSILAGKSQHQLDVAIIAALIAFAVFDMKALRKGFVLSWGTLIFFVGMLIAITILKNQWIAQHAWVLL